MQPLEHVKQLCLQEIYNLVKLISLTALSPSTGDLDFSRNSPKADIQYLTSDIAALKGYTGELGNIFNCVRSSHSHRALFTAIETACDIQTALSIVPTYVLGEKYVRNLIEDKNKSDIDAVKLALMRSLVDAPVEVKRHIHNKVSNIRFDPKYLDMNDINREIDAIKRFISYVVTALVGASNILDSESRNGIDANSPLSWRKSNLSRIRAKKLQYLEV